MFVGVPPDVARDAPPLIAQLAGYTGSDGQQREPALDLVINAPVVAREAPPLIAQLAGYTGGDGSRL